LSGKGFVRHIDFVNSRQHFGSVFRVVRRDFFPYESLIIFLRRNRFFARLANCFRRVAAREFKVLHHDIRADSRFAVARQPRVEGQTPSHENLAAFDQVLRKRFGLSAEGGNIIPIGLFLLTFALSANGVRSNRKVCNGSALRRVAQFDIAPGVSKN